MLTVTLPTNPIATAELTGLRYVTDRSEGIRRNRCGRGFKYLLPDGSVVKNAEELKRIRALVIPPAWTSVWICPSKYGHLQAVGRDARGRKQYRYHPTYRQVRNQTKFSKMASFAAVLPRIRRRVSADLGAPGLSRKQILATVVRLLETTCIRIGNEEYVQQNESFGLTTLRNRHVKIGEHTLIFRFKGKSGLNHEIKLCDRKLARIVHRCQNLPGQELFQYLDDQGIPTPVHSEDVNDYLHEIAGADFTAKDFRTWIGTSQAVLELERLGPPKSATAAKKNVVEAVKRVSVRLGNRPSTCRAYYIHPAVLDSYLSGDFFDTVAKAEPGALRREEAAALAIIEASSIELPKLKRSARKAV